MIFTSNLLTLVPAKTNDFIDDINSTQVKAFLYRLENNACSIG